MERLTINQIASRFNMTRAKASHRIKSAAIKPIKIRSGSEGGNLYEVCPHLIDVFCALTVSEVRDELGGGNIDAVRYFLKKRRVDLPSAAFSTPRLTLFLVSDIPRIKEMFEEHASSILTETDNLINCKTLGKKYKTSPDNVMNRLRRSGISPARTCLKSGAHYFNDTPEVSAALTFQTTQHLRQRCAPMLDKTAFLEILKKKGFQPVRRRRACWPASEVEKIEAFFASQEGKKILQIDTYKPSLPDSARYLSIKKMLAQQKIPACPLYLIKTYDLTPYVAGCLLRTADVADLAGV